MCSNRYRTRRKDILKEQNRYVQKQRYEKTDTKKADADTERIGGLTATERDV